jgi:hypothetical protein
MVAWLLLVLMAWVVEYGYSQEPHYPLRQHLLVLVALRLVDQHQELLVDLLGALQLLQEAVLAAHLS